MRAAGALLSFALVMAACDRESGTRAPSPAAAQAEARSVTEAAAAGATPMAQRVAVIGFLNKRNGIARDLVLRPGQAVRIKDAVVRLRACEASPPWETEQLTGAFLQLDVQQANRRWARAFSGWIYKESPSLNVVEHPVFDVWPKSCAMNWPAAASLAPGGKSPPANSPSRRSSAKKSPPPARAAPAPPATDSPPAAGSPPPAPPPPAQPAEPLIPADTASDSNPT